MISLSLSLADSQLYQEYSEVVQNREILLSHTDSMSISGDNLNIRSSPSPNHSPKLSHRPLPPLPPVILHPHTLFQTNPFKSLNVPQQSINRPPSPHLSISASSPTLWQELPGVRSSPDFGELTEDTRRLQEVELLIHPCNSYIFKLDLSVHCIHYLDNMEFCFCPHSKNKKAIMKKRFVNKI